MTSAHLSKSFGCIRNSVELCRDPSAKRQDVSTYWDSCLLGCYLLCPYYTPICCSLTISKSLPPLGLCPRSTLIPDLDAWFGIPLWFHFAMLQRWLQRDAPPGPCSNPLLLTSSGELYSNDSNGCPPYSSELCKTPHIQPHSFPCNLMQIHQEDRLKIFWQIPSNPFVNKIKKREKQSRNCSIVANSTLSTLTHQLFVTSSVDAPNTSDIKINKSLHKSPNNWEREKWKSTKT